MTRGILYVAEAWYLAIAEATFEDVSIMLGSKAVLGRCRFSGDRGVLLLLVVFILTQKPGHEAKNHGCYSVTRLS